MTPSIIDRIYNREQWGARNWREFSRQGLPVEAFVHHSGPENGRTLDTMNEQIRTVQGFQNYHMDTHGWDDIAYHFVVFQWVGKTPMARAFKGRPSTHTPAAQEKHNTRTLAICVVGNGDKEPMQANTRFMIETLIRRYPTIMRIGGHRDVVQTSCPGSKFYAAIPRIADALDLPHF